MVLDGGLSLAKVGVSLSETALDTLLFGLLSLRFAGLPANEALIVGPAEEDAGSRVVGAYYPARNAVVVPSAAIGG